MTTTISIETMNKINRILAGLTNCRLEFTPMSALDKESWDSDDLRKIEDAEADAPRFLTDETGASLGFPVRTDGALAGLAVIRGLANPTGAPGEEIAALAELLAAVIGNRMTREDSGLKSLEEKLALQIELENQSGNVTQIRPTRLSRVRRLREDLDTMERKGQQRSTTSTEPLLIESESNTSIARMAFELHERSERWAFLSLHDLASDTLDTRENLKGLGAITLFIQDLSALTAAQQIRLAEYLSAQPTSEMPQIIAGITSNEKRENILPALLSHFTVARWPLSTATESSARMADDFAKLNSTPVNDPTQANRGRLIPFDLRMLDPDQAPVH